MFPAVSGEFADCLVAILVKNAPFGVPFDQQSSTAGFRQILKCNVKTQIIISLKEDAPTKTIVVAAEGCVVPVMLQVNVMAYQ